MSAFATLNNHVVPPQTNITHRSKIVHAFSSNPSLADRIDEFICTHSDHVTVKLFEDIAAFVSGLSTDAPIHQREASASLPAAGSKKRKLEGGAVTGDAASKSGRWADSNAEADFSVADMSFSIPQRKKLKLECSGYPNGWIRAIGNEVAPEFGIDWQDIDQIFCLPVPEKAKKQYNFVVIPAGGDGIAPAPGAPDCIVWTVNKSGPSEGAESDAEPAHTSRVLSTHLAKIGKALIVPDEEEFISGMPKLKKDDKAYHVKAHRGSKDGYLFFLPPGIIWVFKKPILFLPFSAITSISYTSVLQRTFNLNIGATSLPGPDGSTNDQEIEFAMIDQADFAGIDAYIKRHGLNDASLAKERRAKVYHVNKPREQGATTGVDAHENGQGEEGSDEETELQKAERMLQDEEDDNEEDYVDDENGSGSEDGSSEEEEGYENGGAGDGDEVFDEEEEFAAEEGGYEDEAE